MLSEKAKQKKSLTRCFGLYAMPHVGTPIKTDTSGYHNLVTEKVTMCVCVNICFSAFICVPCAFYIALFIIWLFFSIPICLPLFYYFLDAYLNSKESRKEYEANGRVGGSNWKE